LDAPATPSIGVREVKRSVVARLIGPFTDELAGLRAFH
jgi:hypothetical protein